MRVAVEDRRRLLREGLALLLDAEPGMELVTAVADHQLPAGTGRVDVLLRSDREQGPPPAGARVLTYTGREGFAALAAAVLRVSAHNPPGPNAPDTPRLTSRELQVVQGIADGLSTTRIAQRLGLAPKSVDNHKQRIFTKLDVNSGSQAVAVARRTGLLEPAGDGDPESSR